MKAQDITINPNILLWRSSNTWCNSGEKAGYRKTKSSSSNVIMWKGGYMTVFRTTASANNRRDNKYVTRTCVVVKEVSKQAAWDRLITDNKDVLLTLEFHHDRLQSTHDVHVRLADRTQHNTSNYYLLLLLLTLVPQLIIVNFSRCTCIPVPVTPPPPNGWCTNGWHWDPFSLQESPRSHGLAMYHRHGNTPIMGHTTEETDA